MNHPQESNQEKSHLIPMRARAELISRGRFIANAAIPVPVVVEQPRSLVVEKVVKVNPLAYTEQVSETHQPSVNNQATVTDINVWRVKMQQDAYIAAENARRAA